MGGVVSRSYDHQASVPKLPTTSSGFLGRGRMVQDYRRKIRIYVNKITPAALGQELLKQCGNEGRHAYLDATRYTTLRFLRAAISFIPDACDEGADMRNAAFIFAQPGREFVIKAGHGDWEFYFLEDQFGSICGRCVRKPFRHYVWDKTKSVVRCFGSMAGKFLSIAGPGLLALTMA